MANKLAWAPASHFKSRQSVWLLLLLLAASSLLERVPAAVGNAVGNVCNPPPLGSDTWCPSPYVEFNLDCDLDGLNDWVCTSSDWWYATSLSTEECVPRRQDGDRSACSAALDAVATGNGHCPIVQGYSAKINTDSSGDDLGMVTSRDDGQEFTSLQEMLDTAAANCTQDIRCVAFNSAGYIKQTVDNADARSGVCLYTKTPPGASEGCPRPPEDSAWCPRDPSAGVDYVLFNLDCDGDGLKDWACTSMGWYNAVSLSIDGCVSYRQDGVRSTCAPALNASADGHCLTEQGYTAWMDTDGTGINVEHMVTLQDNGQPFSSLQQLLETTAASCTQNAQCMAFTSAGYLKLTADKLSTDSTSGVCLYTKDSAGLADGGCSRPSLATLSDSTSWCPYGSAIFKLDCDGDGLEDWACSFMDWWYAASLSKADCVPHVGNGRRSACPPALDVLTAGGGECPHIDGYTAVKDTDSAVDANDLSNSDLGQVMSQDNGQPFASMQQFLDTAAAACTNNKLCTAFNSAGLATTTVDMNTPARGGCLYIKNAANGTAATPVLLTGSLGTRFIFNGKNNHPMTYYECRDACRAANATPPLAKDAAHYEELVGVVGAAFSGGLSVNVSMTTLDEGGQRTMWLGLFRSYAGGPFVWEDGTPLADDVPAYWGNLQPDNEYGAQDCVEANAFEDTYHTWNDNLCDSVRRVCLCQLPAGAESDPLTVPPPYSLSRPTASPHKYGSVTTVGGTRYWIGVPRQFQAAKVPYTACQHVCKGVGGSLPLVKSAAQNSSMWTALGSYGKVQGLLQRPLSEGLWVGLMLTKWNDNGTGEYVWEDGSSLGLYRPWSDKQPDNYGMRQTCVGDLSGAWWDFSCMSSVDTLTCACQLPPPQWPGTTAASQLARLSTPDSDDTYCLIPGLATTTATESPTYVTQQACGDIRQLFELSPISGSDDLVSTFQILRHVISGLCMEVPNVDVNRDGAIVQMANCTGQYNQQFTVEGYSGRIAVRASGKCLTMMIDSYPYATVVARLHQSSCIDDPVVSQLFTVQLEGPAAALSPQKVQMVTNLSSSGQCLGATYNYGATLPLGLQPQTCSNVSNTTQEFELVPVADYTGVGTEYWGYFVLRHALTGGCLEFLYQSIYTDGVKGFLANCTGWTSQHFYIDTAHRGRIMSRTSNKCLDIAASDSGSVASGQLQQVNCKGPSEASQDLFMRLPAPHVPAWWLHVVTIATLASKFTACIDLPGGAAALEGTQLVQYPCNSMAAGQMFSLEPMVDQSTGAINGFFALRHAFSNLCIEDDGAAVPLNSTDAIRVVARACTGQWHQHFFIDPRGRIVSWSKARCITVQWVSEFRAILVQLLPCNDLSSDQVFRILLRGEQEALSPYLMQAYSSSSATTPVQPPAASGSPAALLVQPPSLDAALQLEATPPPAPVSPGLPAGLLSNITGISILSSQPVSVATLVSRGAQCLDPTAAISLRNNGTWPVLLQRCSHMVDQQLQMVLVANDHDAEHHFLGYFMLQHAPTGSCVQLEQHSDLDEGSTALLVMAPCTDDPSQQFNAMDLGVISGFTLIVSSLLGCLKVPDAEVFDGAEVRAQYNCPHDAMDMLFAISLQGSAGGLAITADARVATQHSNFSMCLDVAAGSDEVQQHACNSTSPSQVFDLLPMADGGGTLYMGYLQLRHRQTGRCMQLDGDNTVSLAKCDEQLRTQLLSVYGNGRMQGRGTYKCLVMQDESDGALLTQAECEWTGAADNQLFKLALTGLQPQPPPPSPPEDDSQRTSLGSPALPLGAQNPASSAPAPAATAPGSAPAQEAIPQPPLREPQNSSLPLQSSGQPPGSLLQSAVLAVPIQATGSTSTLPKSDEQQAPGPAGSTAGAVQASAKKHVPVGAIAGAAAGAALLFTVIIGALVLAARKRRAQRDSSGGKDTAAAAEPHTSVTLVHALAPDEGGQVPGVSDESSQQATTIAASGSAVVGSAAALASMTTTATSKAISSSGTGYEGRGSSSYGVRPSPSDSRSILSNMSWKRLFRSISSVNIVVPHTPASLAHRRSTGGEGPLMVPEDSPVEFQQGGRSAPLPGPSGVMQRTSPNPRSNLVPAWAVLEAAGKDAAASELPSTPATTPVHGGLLQMSAGATAPLLPSGIQQWNFHISSDELSLNQQLGRGGFGDVYRGMWRGTPVAVKLVSLTLLSADELDRCKEEIKLMFRLHHPNIVQLLGAAVMPSGHLAIVMELVVRGSLFALLHGSSGPDREVLDARRQLRMAVDTAKGIQYLHGMKPPLVHRDIKSMNLLVTADWGIKVCDFGLSRPKHATFLSTLSPAGTPAWMPPEALLGQNCNEKSDVYSFGMVLYELFTGRIPWSDTGQNVFQMAHIVGHMGLRPDLPSEGLEFRLAALIQSCWAQDSAERPSIDEALEVLRGINWQDLARLNGPNSKAATPVCEGIVITG